MSLDLFKSKILSFDNPLVLASNENILARYYKGLMLAESILPKQALYNPENSFLRLPDLTEKLVSYFENSAMSWSNLNAYKSNNLALLNLMMNPNSNTTKIFASLLTVAKIINHIHNTNETVIILTPSSGNKAIAFREAVAKAITLNLVPKEKLRTISIIPKASENKSRDTLLDSDEEFRKLNPIFSFSGQKAEDVKKIALNFLEENDSVLKSKNIRLWYSLHLDNYRLADATRAFFDYELSLHNHKKSEFGNQWHAHSVSSAFGLLGYDLGCQVLAQENILSESEMPGYFLTQHLATPDLILYLYNNNFDIQNMPSYHWDNDKNFFVQNVSQFFPEYTANPGETIDHTFYTKAPSTAHVIQNLIKKQGGAGIVVSLAECFDRYSQIKDILKNTPIHLPDDTQSIREWSLIMALTGVLNAIDRKIIPDNKNILIHGSGLYMESDIHRTHQHHIDINEENALKIISGVI